MDEIIIRPSAKIHYFKISILALIAILIVYLIGNFFQFDYSGWIIGIIILTIVSYAIIYVIIHHHYIKLSEDEIEMQSGVISTRNVSILYGNITNLNITKTVLERIFLLGTIEVDTSGTNKIEMKMENIPKEKIERIDEILKEKQVETKK